MKQKIIFRVNPSKAIEVILWFCSQEKMGVNQYNLLKSLFYAEVEHLNKYGRPIIGDTYMAMPYGTVPSLVYDLLNANELVLNSYKIKKLPFERVHNLIKGIRDFDVDAFSDSDIECLQNAFNKYGHISFNKLCDLNHEHTAWKQTRKKAPNSPIPFELLIKDEHLLSDLANYSQYMAL